MTDVAGEIRVADDPAKHRYEAILDDQVVGVSVYELLDDRIVFLHTEVDSGLEGMGVGSRLAKGALDDVRRQSTPEVPLSLRNSRTDLMKSEGYGAGYRYAHDDAPDGMNDRYLPVELAGRVYYEPKESGAEAEIKARLDRWREARKKRSGR